MTTHCWIATAVLILQTVAIAYLRWRNRDLARDLADSIDMEARYLAEARKLSGLYEQIKATLEMATPIRFFAVLICSMLLTSVASAQTTEPVYRTDTVGSIVTNGQLQNREFSLLLIHSGDQLSIQVLGMVSQPKSTQLRQWTEGLHLRPMHVSEPFVEHHGDLLQKHQGQFPILALVDQAGGAWWSAAGNQLAMTETTLVQQLATAYSETLRVARTNQQPPNTKQQSMDWGGYGPGYAGPGYAGPGPSPSRFLDRGVSAPDPVPVPSVNITTNGVPPQPAAQPTGDEALILLGVLAIVCSLILAGGVVGGSSIVANAMTDEQETE